MALSPKRPSRQALPRWNARAGLELFYGKAGCGTCHAGPLLTDHGFHAMGQPQIGPGKGGRFERHARDDGRLRVTGRQQDRFAFRTPSLRNVTRKDVALAEMCRVLRPGGRLLVLEFSKPRNPLLSRAYDAFAATWPMMGKLIADDADSYRYLNESIRMHPPQEELASMMEQAGFDAVRFHDLLGGIVAIHRGIAP